MKYQLFADMAERDGLENIARLFRAIAYAERVHASNHFKALGLLGKDVDNLQTAIDGENYEVKECTLPLMPWPIFRAKTKPTGAFITPWKLKRFIPGCIVMPGGR